METENIRVSLRPRGGWEAVDLGFRMARVWWRPLFGAWLAVVVPTALLLSFLLWGSLWLAALTTWWLKPAFDRVALFVLSEALFGRAPSVRQTLRALPSLLRSGLVRSLCILRLSPMRSLVLPVLQLEGLRGRAWRSRIRLLVGREFPVGFGLMIACIHFELFVVVLGSLSLVWIFPEAGGDLGLFELVSVWLADEGSWRGAVGNGILVLAMSAIEPFYVAAGFSVYINRRVFLEGWDIDLEFRKLARRAASSAPAPIAAMALALGLLHAPQARAAECTDRPEAARECIEAVMQSPEFETVRTVEIWVPKGVPDARVRSEGPSGIGLSRLAESLALLFQVALWAGAALLLVNLVRRMLRGTLAAAPGSSHLEPGPEIQMRAHSGPESLPADPLAEARARFADGDAIAALSLLYRGALAYLSDARGLGLPASATEGECARIVRARVEEDLARDFAALILAWQRCAYAGRGPDLAAFQSLCEDWRGRLEAVA